MRALYPGELPRRPRYLNYVDYQESGCTIYPMPNPDYIESASIPNNSDEESNDEDVFQQDGMSIYQIPMNPVALR